MKGRACLLAALAALPLACASTLRPVQQPNRLALPPARFSHAALDRVLSAFVDAAGLVDYAGLARRPFDLDAYLGQVAAWSPDRHPALFPDDAARLAYWLNAYNAVALRLVLEHHPIGSVRDVRPWWAAALPDGAGFFQGHQFPLGGRATSLWALEHRIVRRRFADPRVHFALACASLGCPRLPRRAFDPARLDAQLAEGTRRFFAEARNFRMEAGSGAVHLSPILDRYRGDFERWQAGRGREATLLAFVADHAAPAEAAAARDAAARGFAVRFAPFDWRLDDRAHRRPPSADPPRLPLDPAPRSAHPTGTVDPRVNWAPARRPANPRAPRA